METKELMLGDLVLCGGRVCRVLELGGMACVTPTDKAEELFCNDKDIEPIPLTPEILFKNGFKDAQFYSELLWNDAFQIISDCSTLSIRCKNSDLSLNIPCDEVHELQHALKLCGIDKTIEL